MSDDETILGCVSVDSGGIVALGSTKARCAECSTPVWVAPSSKKMLAAGAKPTCLECCARRVAADDWPDEVMPISDEQIREMVTTMLLHARRN